MADVIFIAAIGAAVFAGCCIPILGDYVATYFDKQGLGE